MTLTKDRFTGFYEVTEGGFDYHIRLDDCSNRPSPLNPWFVDSFRSSESNNDASHVGTNAFDSFEEAIDFILTDGLRSK
jgi:hypothetical protein